MEETLKQKINKVNNQQEQEDEMLKWSPEDRFYFSGNEFGNLINTLKNVCESPVFIEELMKAKQTIAIASANEILNKKVNSCLASGQIRKISKKQFDLEQEQERKAEQLVEHFKDIPAFKGQENKMEPMEPEIIVEKN